MARIKYTKTELKAQNDALDRFERFLPMLQLKKQQLQLEIAAITARIGEVDVRIDEQRKTTQAWVALFGKEDVPDNLVELEQIVVGRGNIAGVSIPVFQKVRTRRASLDLYATPSWHDDAQDLIETRLALAAEKRILATQRELVTRELTSTSQRVNLFEKVKIPECRENIRVIRIHLGDEQTSAVARGKMAKRRGGGRRRLPVEEAAS